MCRSQGDHLGSPVHKISFLPAPPFLLSQESTGVTQAQVIDLDSLTRLPTFTFNLTANFHKSSEKSNAHVGPRFAKYVGIEQAIQVLYGLENPASPAASLCEAKRRG